MFAQFDSMLLMFSRNVTQVDSKFAIMSLNFRKMSLESKFGVKLSDTLRKNE